MKHQQFATRQKSEELIKEIINIWKQGNQKENLEGIEQDPVFGLLVTALAHRTGEIEGEIEMFKMNLLDELSGRLIPHNQCRATPAATVVTTSVMGDLGQKSIGADAVFTLDGTSYRFVPLFDTLIVNGAVSSVLRMDGRRWKVSLALKEPLTTLRGMSFLLDLPAFTDLSISLDNHSLALVKPWDYANLPLSSIFSINSRFYNNDDRFSPINRWLDISSQLDAQLFYVGYAREQNLMLSERDHLDLVFEFSGIDEGFEFTAQDIKINAVPLVNVEQSWVDISSYNPIVRLLSENTNGSRRDFLGLLPPSDDSSDYLHSVNVREVGADRFSELSLYRLVKGVLDRFSSDYYAFQDVPTLRDGAKLQDLYHSLMAISKELLDVPENENAGSYLALTRDAALSQDQKSFRVKYLTTDAEQVNGSLSASSQFLPEKSLSLSLSTAVCEPLLGVASVVDASAQSKKMKYNLMTQDRLVTPADVKAFCLMELGVRYGIDSELVNAVSVEPRLKADNRAVQYVMEVKIYLEPTLYVKRAIQNLGYVEHLLSRMLSVRSVGVFAFDVKVFI